MIKWLAKLWSATSFQSVYMQASSWLQMSCVIDMEYLDNME